MTLACQDVGVRHVVGQWRAPPTTAGCETPDRFTGTVRENVRH